MFPFHLVQSANTEFLIMKTHRVFLNRLSKYAMCVIVKTKWFYSPNINSESKLKKISTLFLRHLPLATKLTIFRCGLFDWNVLEIHSLFVKDYLNLNFFQVLQSTAFLKKRNKNLFRKNACNLKITCNSKRQKINIKKEKEKRNMRKDQ